MKEWAKKHPNGYEVSSLGDKRFSALTARLKSGKTIEEAWAAAKGYPSIRAAKGKPAKSRNFDYWGVYLGLWEKWAAENPRGIEELERVSRGKVLTDQFAKTDNNQARALATIINERSATPPAKTTKKKAATPKKKATTKSASTRTPRKPRKTRRGHAPVKRGYDKGKKFDRTAWPVESADPGEVLLAAAKGSTTALHPETHINILEVYPINPLGAAWAEVAITADVGSEREAVSGVDFGLLSRLPVEKVVGFAYNVKRSGDQGFPFPLEVLSSHQAPKKSKEGLITKALIASGPTEAPGAFGGTALAPFNDRYGLGNSTVKALILLLIGSRVWNRAARDWAGVLVFRLPFPSMEVVETDKGEMEVDVTRGEELVSYLCGGEFDECPSASFTKDLIAAANSLRSLGQEDEWPDWLTHTGVESRGALRETLDDMLRRTREDPEGKIANLRIGFYDPQGKKRIFAEPDYYGSSRFARRVGSYRRDARKLLEQGLVSRPRESREKHDYSGQDYQKEPMSFDELLALAKEKGDEAAIKLIDQIGGLSGELSLNAREYENAVESEILKLEDKVWKAGKIVSKEKKKRKKRKLSVLPILTPSDVQKTPVKEIAFTLYWVDPNSLSDEDNRSLVVGTTEEGQPIKVFPLEIINRVVFTKEEAQAAVKGIFKSMGTPEGIQADPRIRAVLEDAQKKAAKKGYRVVFSQTAALRMAALHKMDIPNFNFQWEQEGAAPLKPILIATISTGLQAAKSWAKAGISGLRAPGEIQPKVGVYFSSIDLPTVATKRYLHPDAWESPYELVGPTDEVPQGIVTYGVPKAASGIMVADLAGVQIKPSGRILLPTLGGSGLFSFENISQTESYHFWLTDPNSPLVVKETLPEDLPYAAYRAAISSGTSGWYGTAPGTKEKVEGGRAGYKEFKGTQVQAGKKRGRGHKEVSKRSGKKTIFGFVLNLCKLPEVRCLLEPKAAQVTLNDIEATLRSLGIEGGVESKEALLSLKRFLEAQLAGDYYTHEADLGEVRGTDFLEGLAKPNRGSRMARKPRRPRRGRRSERNPLRPTADEAIVYAQRGTKDSREALAKQIEAQNRDLAPKDWPITQAGVDTLFPMQGDVQAWSIGRRFPAMAQYDLVSSVGPERLSPRLAAKVDSEVPFPWMNTDVKAHIVKEAGLSVKEAAQIISAQRQRRRSPRTMQASSAICKNQRTKKLKGYYPPNEFMHFDEMAEAKIVESRDLVIWLSPQGFKPRVMSIRRGVHIDCDMVGTKAGDLPDLFAAALQSSLYWLAEKPKRQLATNVWVGRAGERAFYNAWRAEDWKTGPLTLQRVFDNLSNRGRWYWGDAEQADYDKERYRGALTRAGLLSEELRESS